MLGSVAGWGSGTGATSRVRRDYGRAPEDQLVGWAQEYDGRAFEELVNRQRSLVFTLCYRITGHREDALDAAQRAITDAWQSIGRFRRESAFSTWLHRIAVNAALRETEQRRRGPLPFPADCLAHLAGYDRGSPERLAVGQAMASWALSQLAPQFRAPLVLRELAGYSYEEIAEMLDRPLNTVRVQIFRARRALASVMEAEGVIR